MSLNNKPTRYEHLGIKSHACAECGLQQQLLAGAVFDQNDDLLSLFGATLQEHSCPTSEHANTRWVGLRMGLKLKDETGKMLEDRTFSMMLINRDNVVGTKVVDGPPDEPGRALSEDEALKSPFISLIFEIDDFIVDKEPRLREFLGCD